MRKELAVGFAAFATTLTGAATVRQHRWHERLLLVFAPDDAAAKLKSQRIGLRTAGPMFEERDLVLVEVIGETVSGLSESAPELRKRYRVAPLSFRALLIGKDGGVKLDSGEPITARQLAETIDAMPMRRDEVPRK